MKILYLSNILFESEYANLVQVLSMCKAMSELGNEVILSIPSLYYKTDNKIIDIYNYKILLRKGENRFGKFKKYLDRQAIRSVVNTIKPDLIYLREPLLLSQISNLYIPIIMELHNNKLHLGYNFLNNYWKYYVIKNTKNNRIKLIVTISNALTNFWVKEGIPKEKIITEHDCVDTELYKNELSKKEAREILKIDSNRPIITYLGRIYKNRRIDDIVKLSKIFNEINFYVVGGPNERAEFYSKLANKENINNLTFVGQVPHEKTPLYLYASDILLALWSKDVPTINYCSPLKIFEYMASGRIIIAYNFPTIGEVLKNNETALLVEPESIQGLAEAINYALNNDLSDLGRNARREAFINYSWYGRAHRILNKYYIINKE